jgi:hypothetical protein
MTGLADLDAALEQLYSVYARYPLPERSAFCDHCVSPDDVAETRSKPLRELTANDLDRYAWNALSTWGDLAEFKHFMPRLLELVARAGDFGALHAPPLLTKVGARWEEWPHDEQGAVRGFIDAWWRTTLNEFPSRPDVLEVLEAIAATGVDIDPYLATWNRPRTNRPHATSPGSCGASPAAHPPPRGTDR